MYKKTKMPKTTLTVNQCYDGETIEQKIRRIMEGKEPITDGAPIIYTDRKAGVLPEHNIRTDRFEVAIDAMDKVAQAHIAKRTEAPVKNIGEAKSIPQNAPDTGASNGGL